MRVLLLLALVTKLVVATAFAQSTEPPPAWRVLPSGTKASFRAVWGTSASDVFAVGEKGTILHYDGKSWTPQQSGTTQHLNAIHGTSSNNVFVVGDKGSVLQFDGSRWVPHGSGETRDLNGVWVASASEVFVTGDKGVLLHYEGNKWGGQAVGGSFDVNAIWGTSPTDVYAAGYDKSAGILQTQNYLLHYDGRKWITKAVRLYHPFLAAPEIPCDVYDPLYLRGDGSGRQFDCNIFQSIVLYFGFEDLSFATSERGIWSRSPSDIFVITTPIRENNIEGPGAVVHYDGRRWTQETYVGRWGAAGIWGAPSGELFVVGRDGFILHRRAEVDAAIFNNEPLSYWVKQIKDPDVKTRRTAAVAIGALGDGSHTSLLVDVMKNPDKTVRGRAAGALGNLRPVTPEGIAALMAVLKDVQFSVRWSALGALGEMGSLAKDALAVVREIAEKDTKKDMRQKAAQTVSKIEGTFDRGTVTGRTLDTTAKVVPGATITAKAKTGSDEQRATSDQQGAFRLVVPRGSYQVRVEAQGFKPFVREDVRISTKSKLDFYLSAAAASGTPKEADSKATVYVFNSTRLRRQLSPPWVPIYCDEVKLAALRWGRFFVAKVEPGAHVFSYLTVDARIEMEFEGGREYYLSFVDDFIFSFSSVEPDAQLLPKEAALLELKNLEPIDSDRIFDRSRVTADAGVSKK